MSRFTEEDDALLGELGVEVEAKKDGGRTAREERIIAGFEDIQRFIEQHGRTPQHGEDRDIFERLYAVRLDRLRAQPDCVAVLTGLDHQGLLTQAEVAVNAEDLDDDALLAELGVEIEPAGITDLQYVRSASDKRAAEEIANSERCEEFERFEPLFEQAKRELATGIRSTRPVVKDSGFLKADIVQGQFFVLNGQTAYVAEVGEEFQAPNGQSDARLRVIYSNGTESNLLRRSLQRALYKDEAGRRITEPTPGPLFSDTSEESDLTSGTVYVLRSKSDDPVIAPYRDVLHKIGVTGGDVARRIANARLDPTFLMADVEIVATYKLIGINRTRLENLIHRLFGNARLDIGVIDRLGKPIAPREWFLVPLFVIDEAIERIKDGSIKDYVYDAKKISLEKSR